MAQPTAAELIALRLPENTRVAFHTLPIGARFDLGLIEWSGIRRGEVGWLVLEKVDKSHARCVAQVGFGNERALGAVNSHAASQQVFPHRAA